MQTQQTLPELHIELAAIDSTLAYLKREKEVAWQRETMLRPKHPRIARPIPLCFFTIITDRGTNYPLSAYAKNAKQYATDLHKETGCTVRPVNQQEKANAK